MALHHLNQLQSLLISYLSSSGSNGMMPSPISNQQPSSLTYQHCKYTKEITINKDDPLWYLTPSLGSPSSSQSPTTRPMQISPSSCYAKCQYGSCCIWHLPPMELCLQSSWIATNISSSAGSRTPAGTPLVFQYLQPLTTFPNGRATWQHKPTPN